MPVNHYHDELYESWMYEYIYMNDDRGNYRPPDTELWPWTHLRGPIGKLQLRMKLEKSDVAESSP